MRYDVQFRCTHNINAVYDFYFPDISYETNFKLYVFLVKVYFITIFSVTIFLFSFFIIFFFCFCITELPQNSRTRAREGKIKRERYFYTGSYETYKSVTRTHSERVDRILRDTVRFSVFFSFFFFCFIPW